jgi:hypothetical protein
MIIYETEYGFSELKDEEKLPLGAKPYDLYFPCDMKINSEIVFPQFELRIKSHGAYKWTTQLQIVYKNSICFSPSISNPYYYIIALLNDLKKNDYEEKILEYIKAEVSIEKYLEIKGKLRSLSNIEELQLTNAKLSESLNELQEIKKEIQKIKYDIEKIVKPKFSFKKEIIKLVSKIR